MEPLSSYIAVSAVLLGLGVYGLIAKRNAVRMLFAILVIENAANLNLVAFSRHMVPVDPTGQALAIFSIAVGAATAAIGLAIIILVFRLTGDVDLASLRRMRE